MAARIGATTVSRRHRRPKRPRTIDSSVWKRNSLPPITISEPLAGVALGWHKYDGKFVVPVGDAVMAEKKRLEKAGLEFRALSGEKLSLEHRHDLRLLMSAISLELWTMSVQRSYTHNPMTYATALDTTVYLEA